MGESIGSKIFNNSLHLDLRSILDTSTLIQNPKSESPPSKIGRDCLNRTSRDTLLANDATRAGKIELEGVGIQI
jgi:hypothetical protein